jgi:DNA repair exonuclease SbcCD ATPase subunit
MDEDQVAALHLQAQRLSVSVIALESEKNNLYIENAALRSHWRARDLNDKRPFHLTTTINPQPPYPRTPTPKNPLGALPEYRATTPTPSPTAKRGLRINPTASAAFSPVAAAKPSLDLLAAEMEKSEVLSRLLQEAKLTIQSLTARLDTSSAESDLLRSIRANKALEVEIASLQGDLKKSRNAETKLKEDVRWRKSAVHELQGSVATLESSLSLMKAEAREGKSNRQRQIEKRQALGEELVSLKSIHKEQIAKLDESKKVDKATIQNFVDQKNHQEYKVKLALIKFKEMIDIARARISELEAELTRTRQKYHKLAKRKDNEQERLNMTSVPPLPPPRTLHR